GDRAALSLPGALEQARQHREDARRIAAPRGRLAEREAHFALSTCHARDRVNEEQHVPPLVPEALGDRGRHLRGAQPFERRRITRRDHDDRALAPSDAQRVLEEVAHLAPALTDERDHDGIGGRAAGDRAEQRALADSRAREQTNPLPDAERQQAVDDAHSRGQRRRHRRAAQRGRRRGPHGNAPEARERGAAVEGPSEPVEHPSEQRAADLHLEALPRCLDGVVDADAQEVAERQRERFPALEPDDFGEQRRAAAPDAQDVADPCSRNLRAHEQAEHAGDAPDGTERRRLREPRPQPLEVHERLLTRLARGGTDPGALDEAGAPYGRKSCPRRAGNATLEVKWAALAGSPSSSRIWPRAAVLPSKPRPARAWTPDRKSVV